MSTSYYDRRRSPGQAAFANADDAANEEHVRAVVEAAWRVELHRYAAGFSAIDFYAVRGNRIAAHVEIKSRSHESGKYDSVFLNMRKWHGLITAWLYTGLPSLFFVKFTDEIRWIDVRDVDARKVRLGGCSRIVKAKSDVEPVIEVPIGQMNILKTKARTHE